MHRVVERSEADDCRLKSWGFAVGLCLLTAGGAFSLGAPACHASGQDVLVLGANVPQAGYIEGETDELMGDLLLRELVRQAVLIAARDELGLATRDAALREPAPEGIPHDAILEINTIARKRRGIQITISRNGEVLLDHEVRINIGPVNMHIAVIEQMEQLSRGMLRDVLAETGLQGIAAETDEDAADDGAVSREAESLLRRMDFLSQYEAARLCHDQIREKGESPQRLAALVRAYAHLGQLTQPFLSSMHRAFRARSLLYAQRLIASDPESPWGYWHRAYALSLAGIQRWSYSDLGRAQQKVDAGRTEIETPAWVVLLEHYNHYDYDDLKEATQADDDLSQLAGLLWFTSVETSPCPPLVIETGKAALQANVFDLRVIDGLLNQAGVSIQHSLTLLGPQQFGELLARNFDELESVPADIRSAFGGRENTEWASPLYRGELAETLVEKAADDRSEPSLAVLGRLVEEQNVLHIYRRAVFLRDWLSVDSADLLKQLQPALRFHPYGPLVTAVSYEYRATPDSYQNEVGGVDIGDMNVASMKSLIGRIPESVQLGNMSQGEAWQLLFNQQAPLEFEYYSRMLNRNSRDRVIFAKWMADVSQHSPYRIYVLITEDPEGSQGDFPGWEQEYGEHPLIAYAFSRYYDNAQNDEKAAEYYQRFLQEVPSKDAAIALARIQYREGSEEWIDTLETALNYDDYGLDHAQVNCHIADTLMQEDKYDEALPYARAAAGSYSAWGLLCLAFCEDGLGHHDEADAIVQAIEDRYGSGQLYLWNVRTGRGDLENEWLAYRRRLHTWYAPQDNAHTMAEFRHLAFIDEKEEALEFARAHQSKILGPVDELAVAMLAEELGEEEYCQAVLDELVEDEKAGGSEDDLPMGQFMVELRELPELDSASIDTLLSEHPEVGTGTVLVFVGWHLANEGQTELAKEYLSKISGSRRWTSFDILFAQTKLHELGVDLNDIPRRYPYGFDRD